MINELLQERAALYAAGTMTFREREQFEIILEHHDDLRAFVTGLLEASAATMLGTLRPGEPFHAAHLKSRVMDAVKDRSQLQPAPDHTGFVISGLDGLVQWINPAFTDMCGYAMEELSGKNLGPILQGKDTDSQTVGRMRTAVRAHSPCHETILNYHKNGSPYWVEIDMMPIEDEKGTPLFLIARERELAAPTAPAQ